MNFNYFISEEEFRFVIEAVDLVARDGWRLLPEYDFEPETALWRHRDGMPEPPMSLHDLEFGRGGIRYEDHRHTAGPAEYPRYLAEARRILGEHRPPRGDGPPLDAEAESLRWFPLPAEVPA